MMKSWSESRKKALEKNALSLLKNNKNVAQALDFANDLKQVQNFIPVSVVMASS